MPFVNFGQRGSRRVSLGRRGAKRRMGASIVYESKSGRVLADTRSKAAQILHCKWKRAAAIGRGERRI